MLWQIKVTRKVNPTEGWLPRIKKQEKGWPEKAAKQGAKAVPEILTVDWHQLTKKQEKGWPGKVEKLPAAGDEWTVHSNKNKCLILLRHLFLLIKRSDDIPPGRQPPSN
jgi:hypothetical protein